MIRIRDYRSIFPLTATEIRRLFLRIDDSKSDCWLWTGGTGAGYGRFFLRGALWQAHRVVYELLVGPGAAGLRSPSYMRQQAMLQPCPSEGRDPGGECRAGLGHP